MVEADVGSNSAFRQQAKQLFHKVPIQTIFIREIQYSDDTAHGLDSPLAKELRANFAARSWKFSAHLQSYRSKLK